MIKPLTNEEFQPTKYFSDLQALIETFHPGYRLVSHDSNIRCVLKVAGTDELVGSQFELFCAYQDAVSDTLTLDLELHLKERKNLKRNADEFYEDEVEEDGNKDWAKVGLGLGLGWFGRGPRRSF